MFFILEALAVGSMIAGAQQEGENAHDRRRIAFASQKSIIKESALVAKHKSELADIYRTRRGYMTDEYGNKVDSLLNRVNTSLMDVGENNRSMISKSGLSKSGTIDRMTKLSTEGLTRDLRSGQKSMFTQFSAGMNELGIRQKEEEYKADLELTRLEGEFNVNNEYLKP